MASRTSYFALVLTVIALWCACIFAQDVETEDPAITAGLIRIEPQQAFVTCSEDETTVVVYLVEYANRTVRGDVTFGEYHSAAIPEHEGSDGFLGYILNSEQMEMFNSNESDFEYTEDLACAPETVTYCIDGDIRLPRDIYCAVVINPGEEDLNLLFAVAWEMITTEPDDTEGEDGNEEEDESETPDDSDSPDPFRGFPTYNAGIRNITTSSASPSITASCFTISWFTFVVAVLITVALV